MREFGASLRLFDTGAVRKPKKVAQPFYSTPDWRQLMQAIFKERGRRCEDCGATKGRLYGDHIVEIADGGDRLDRRNVRIVCGSCHGKKTARERARRYHGISNG